MATLTDIVSKSAGLPNSFRPACRPGRIGASALGLRREPTQREVKNAQASEALLTAVSLKNEKELEGDARLIEDRHSAGVLSDAKYRELGEIIVKARAKDWSGAEKRAYDSAPIRRSRIVLQLTAMENRCAAILGRTRATGTIPRHAVDDATPLA